MDADDGEVIDILTTYVPYESWMVDGLRKLAKQERRKKRTTVRFFLVDYSLVEVVETRFKDHGKSTQTFQNKIRDQAEGLLNLSKEKTVCQAIDIQVWLMRCWPCAHFLRFGERVIYFGLFMAHTEATNGAMFIVQKPERNPEESLWGNLSEHIRFVEEHSIRIHLKRKLPAIGQPGI